MEQVRKNEQNKLSRGLRRYFKRSKHLLRKPMEALSSEEQERLALMVEIAPRLADAYRLKNEFLAVMHSESSTVGSSGARLARGRERYCVLCLYPNY